MGLAVNPAPLHAAAFALIRRLHLHDLRAVLQNLQKAKDQLRAQAKARRDHRLAGWKHEVNADLKFVGRQPLVSNCSRYGLSCAVAVRQLLGTRTILERLKKFPLCGQSKSQCIAITAVVACSTCAESSAHM